MDNLKKNVTNWNKFYGAGDKSLAWPCENLIRLMKGSYIHGITRDYKGKTVLDIGFGSGNNIFFLESIGLKVSGVEISSEITKKVHNIFPKTILRVGDNNNIPFDSNSFDYLVAWSVLVYSPTEELVKAALREYARVLKPGGRFFICTGAPKHTFWDKNVPDFRHNTKFLKVESLGQLKRIFKKSFKNVVIGRVTENLMTYTIDNWLVSGVKAS